MNLSIVVLAAGQGKRMKSAIPKVLHPIGGKPMLSHVIDTSKLLLPKQIIIVHSKDADNIKAAINDPQLQWAEQHPPQGTGDALAKAIPLIPSEHYVLVLNADVPLISKETLDHLISRVKPQEMGIVTMTHYNPTGLGRVIRNEQGAILRIVEERDATQEQRRLTEVYTGIVIAKAQALQKWLANLTNHNSQQEYYLTDIVQMAAQDQITIQSTQPMIPHEVLGVNDRCQLALIERIYQQQIVQDLMLNGVTLRDPNRFDLRGTLHCDTDVTIDINVVFEGHNILHKDCYIGPNCVLKDCEIGSGAKILANSHLEGAKIGPQASVGPFARIRPGTVLEEKVKIGNFVEVKNANVGTGSKINHLSYIGDAQIGKDVNIGAGTITCNYDGINKHQTTIEDEVHIGSDTQLIAPIRVGRGATIAAGSTLKQDAPPDLLTVTHRLEQRSLPLKGKALLLDKEKTNKGKE